MGSAAGLASLTGAQAADLPVKAKPVEYVKICSMYGVGYYFIPGTDTCVRIGGYVRAQGEWQASDNGRVYGSTFGAAGGVANPSILGGLNNRLANDFDTTSRAALSFDVRNATEYGQLRAYSRIIVNFTGFGAQNVIMERAFIQWAGFTAGKQQSNFDIFSPTERFSYFDAKTSGDTYNNSVQMVAYTFNFGGGVSATLAAEAPENHFRAGVADGSQACLRG